MPIRSAAWALALLALLVTGCARAKSGWPAWDTFAQRFVEPSGRVVDLTFEQKSTSEGQSYGLFFALVANDRARFDRILKWTDENLAGGQLGEKLPAWHWGIDEHGKWRVKDENPASDADLFIAYALLEAARLWKEPRYAQTGRRLLVEVANKEIVDAGEPGLVLLPGPVGFDMGDGRYRLDPSYIPEFQFRYFAKVDPQGPWQQVWDNWMRMAPKVFKAGVAPDLFLIDRQGKVYPDIDTERGGAYDAIRVYAWAAMSEKDGPKLLRLLKPYAEIVRMKGEAPERVDPETGRVKKGEFSPIGYAGALLPYLHALGEKDLLEKQRQRIQWARMKHKVKNDSNYYDECLILFGEGWLDGHYRFDADGRLITRWGR